MEAGARQLFRSLNRFKSQPDYLQIWPGHGAGSACGKGISAVPSSTVGYERLFNWAFQIEDEAEFVEAVLAGQPEPPRYFAEMKRINKEGPRRIGGFHRPERVPAGRLSEILRSDALIVDTRPAANFAAGHIPGTINIPLDRSFTTWAGWLVPYTRAFYLLVDDRCNYCVDEAVRDLAMIGLDGVAGYFGTEVVEAWETTGHALGTVASVAHDTLAERANSGKVTVIDVRGATEWEAGHIPGVPNIPLGYLADRLAEVPRDTPVVLNCASGGRSAIAASLLQARGYDNIANLAGGYAAWRSAGLPIEKATPRMAEATG